MGKAKSRSESGGNVEKKDEEKTDKMKERDLFYEEAKKKLIAAREKKEKEEKEREKEMKEKNELKNKLHSLSVSDIRAMLVDTLTEKEGMKKLSDYEKKKLLLNLNQAIESKKDEKKRKHEKKEKEEKE